MQNRNSERRSYALGTSLGGDLYRTDRVDTSAVPKTPVPKKKRSAFVGAASIVVKTGIVVLTVIAKGIKATVKLLIPAHKSNATRIQHAKHDALPRENEL